MVTNCQDAAANGETGQWPITKFRLILCWKEAWAFQRHPVKAHLFIYWLLWSSFVCILFWPLHLSCSLLSSSAGPSCAGGFSPTSSSALFLSRSVYSLNDLVHSQELSCTFTWLPHRFKLLSQFQIYRLDAYSLDFSMDAIHPTSNPPFVFLPLQVYYSSWVTLLSCCPFWKSPSHFCFLCSLSIHLWSVNAFFSLSTLSFSAAATDSVRQHLSLGSLL